MTVRVSGRVTCEGQPIIGAIVDIWQADPRGMYDNQIEDLEGMNLRGQFRTDADGRYHFRSVRPAGYPVPTHGPSGELLRAQRRSPFRPAHIHFMVSGPGYKTLITQVFVDDAEHLQKDVTFGVTPSLIGHFEHHETLEGAPEGFYRPLVLAGLQPVARSRRKPSSRLLPSAEAVMSLVASPLNQKTAVVLGGTGGIGLAVAQLFAQAGAAVAVVASRDIAKARGVAVTLEGTAHRGFACRIENFAPSLPPWRKPSRPTWAALTSW